MKSQKVSRKYLVAGGDRMTPAQAARHFKNRETKIKADIRELPLSEKFRLVADALDAGEEGVALALGVGRLAMAELERFA